MDAEKLADALREIIREGEAGVLIDGVTHLTCLYCDGEGDDASGWWHFDECPVAIARKALSETA